MAIYVPRKVSFIALITLIIGILIAFSLRGVYIITVYKLKDQADLFPISKLQDHADKHGGDLKICLKSCYLGINSKYMNTSDWDFASVFWYSSYQRGYDVYNAKSVPDLSEISESYHILFTPGMFSYLNVWIKAKGLLDRTFGFASRPLKAAEVQELDVRNLEKAKEPLVSEEKPVHMINFLKFKEDGGKNEYRKYAWNIMVHLFPVLGGRITVAGEAVDQYWNDVAIATYPDLATLKEMTHSEKWNSVHHYREKGLEDTFVLMSQSPN